MTFCFWNSGPKNVLNLSYFFFLVVLTKFVLIEKCVNKSFFQTKFHLRIKFYSFHPGKKFKCIQDFLILGWDFISVRCKHTLNSSHCAYIYLNWLGRVIWDICKYCYCYGFFLSLVYVVLFHFKVVKSNS